MPRGTPRLPLGVVPIGLFVERTYRSIGRDFSNSPIDGVGEINIVLGDWAFAVFVALVRAATLDAYGFAKPRKTRRVAAKTLASKTIAESPKVYINLTIFL